MLLYERWLRTQLLKGAALNKIERLIYLYQLQPPSAADLALTREFVSNDKPTRLDLRHPSAVKWLADNKLLASFTDSPAYTEAVTKILPNKALRKAVQVLLLARVELDEMSTIIKARYGAVLEPPVLAAYRDAFFDVNIANSESLKTLFKSYPDGFTYKTVYASGSPEIALWKLGFRTEVKKEDAFRLVVNEALMRFMETNTLPSSMQTAIAAEKWVNIMVTADSVLTGTSGKADELLKILKHIKMDTENVTVKSLEEL